MSTQSRPSALLVYADTTAFNQKEIKMKSLVLVIASVFAVSAFAAEPAKAPIATPAVTKADAPKPVVKEDKKAPVKSSDKKDDKKAATPATPASK